MSARSTCWVKVIIGEEVWVSACEESLDEAERAAKSHPDVVAVLDSRWDDPPRDGLDQREIGLSR